MADYEQLVFSGGGLRCFWQGGFLDVVRDALSLQPARVTGVSGGSVSAAAFLAGKGHALLEAMCDAFEPVDANIQLTDMDGEEGRSPHQRVFHDVLSRVFTSEAAARIADGPPFQVNLAYPPGRGLAGLAGTAMTLVYEAELHLVNSPHFNWAQKLGLTSELVDARSAAREGNLVDLLRAAVTIPPVFRTLNWKGRQVVDGGMADQAPMPKPDTGRTLILLTRQYRRFPEDARRTYIAPSKSVPVDKLDFTDPETLRETWDAGRRDGEVFLEKTG